MLNGLVCAAHGELFSRHSLTVCCVCVCLCGERENVCALRLLRFDQGRLGQSGLRYVGLEQAFRREV